MKRDGGSSFALLMELPGQCQAIYNEIAGQGCTRTARELLVLAGREPEMMADLTRGMQGSSNYGHQALVMTSLLMSMTVKGMDDGTPAAGRMETVSRIGRGVDRLYMRVMTQRPDLGLAITGAALNEPEMPRLGRDQVAVAFADASFSVLRSKPVESLALLDGIAKRVREPGEAYLSQQARRTMARHLTTTLDRYPPHIGPQEALRGVGGGQLALDAETTLGTMRATAAISPDVDVQADMARRMEGLQNRLKKPEPA